MRTYMLLATTALLSACGGGGGSMTSTPAPVAPVPPSTGAAPGSKHSFANPTEAKTYVGIGGHQVFDYQTDARLCCDQQAEVYAGNATTVRNSGISIAYDPRDAIFTLRVQDATTGASTNTRFQDPANRTDFGGRVEPQWGTPQLPNENAPNPNIAYLQAGDGNPLSPYNWSGTGAIDVGDNDTPPDGSRPSTYQATTLFYLRPGSETQYVTFAGYVRNELGFTDGMVDGVTTRINSYKLERGAFAYGELTENRGVPTTGSGTYRGSMLATMVFNPTLDGHDASGRPVEVLPSFFQWIDGTSSLGVNFTNSTFELLLNGTVHAPQFDVFTNPRTVLAEGATFTAAGLGTINLVNFGGFKGSFDRASFLDRGVTYNVDIAGSSIDGAFYGPAAQEAGGGFRIVGGTPDERIDILGAFVGKK